jgi:hypothetical protein
MKTFSLSIGARLIIAFAVILSIMVAMTTIAVSRLYSAHRTMQSTVRTHRRASGLPEGNGCIHDAARSDRQEKCG